ncbi:DUF4192 domain-containing protein [Nocardia alba]|uniref:Uncharacterized protein DUF4192 n=1 Tax=Nocardia alba TaxID=225051 RepID=A0A4R1FCG1_9NOCA|nr:DUF4192 domain-containing protein [Nocardia alba]TCJ89568.1 uncharacterized protein DUF4192 [Nocardia alba]
MTPSTNPTRRATRTGPFPRALGCAESTPRYPGGPPHPALRVDEPGELIAALPAMLGFVPERSLVVAVLHEVAGGAAEAIEAVVRFDLDVATDIRLLDEFAACLGSICLREEATGVLAVFVEDRAEFEGEEVARTAELIDVLAQDGIAVRGVWSVPAIAAGERYRSVFGVVGTGMVADPTSSIVAVSQVLEGKQIRGSRQEMTALLVPDDLLCARVRAQLAPADARYRGGLAAATRAGSAIAYQRRALEWVLWQIADTASGAPRAARELARLAATLRDRPIRDAVYGLAVGDHAEAAERLWAQLARATPGADRAEAAALLGFSAYLRGDGPFAGVALAAAVEADPEHAMAVLLETSLQTGLRPERLRGLALCGHRIAADLGVGIGPITR